MDLEKLENSELYITELRTANKTVYFETPEAPNAGIWDDIDELLEEKYATTVDVEFVYIDNCANHHYGSVTVKERNDYADLEMEDDDFYDATQLTDENLIDLIDEGS
tara:strand:- start:589 stop:909 length:321 start_codon:yes stop_codon:yes gene_type:complete